MTRAARLCRRHCRRLRRIESDAVWRFWARRLFRIRDPWADLWDIAVVQTADHTRAALTPRNPR